MYGMSEKMLSEAQYKVKSNKAFMASHGLLIDDKVIPFKDFVSNAYVNSDRYVAELQHRAWSIYEYSLSRHLSCVFITLTLPSEWHPKKSFKGKLKNNPKWGGRHILFKTVHPITGKKCEFFNPEENRSRFTPRNASRQLSKLLKKIFDDRSYKSIEKDDRCYFRVTEPHKDGTPHLHISLFVPEENVPYLVKRIQKIFPAPQSKIELDVKSPVKYLMKYVLKTLDDLRGDVDDITALTLWYVYHGISRFYTSRTFVSLEVYRRLKGAYTLQELTESYRDGSLKVWYYSDKNAVAHIENEYGTLYTPKPILSRFSDSKWRDDIDADEKTYFEYEFEPIKFAPKERKAHMEVIIDGQEYFLIDGVLQNKPKKMPYQMGDFELMNYFENLDINECIPAHYAYTHRLMCERGLLDEKPLIISEFDEAMEVF